MTMKALTVHCVIQFESTFTNDKLGENNCNTYDKKLTSFINKEYIQTKNKKVNSLKNGQNVRTADHQRKGGE